MIDPSPRALRAELERLEGFLASDPDNPGLVAEVAERRLRLGEIEAALGRDALATRHLVRGLALTDSAATAADPLRKTGIVVLADVTHRRNRPRRLVAMLEEELRYVDPWWDAAYRYLGYRAGNGDPPTGDNPFAQAVKTLKRIEKVEARIRRVLREAEEREDF